MCWIKLFLRPLEASRPCPVHGASIVRRLRLWLTRFSYILVMDRKKALISLTVFKQKNEMRVHIQFASTCNNFQSPRSYRAHALSSVAKSSLTHFDMSPKSEHEWTIVSQTIDPNSLRDWSMYTRKRLTSVLCLSSIGRFMQDQRRCPSSIPAGIRQHSVHWLAGLRGCQGCRMGANLNEDELKSSIKRKFKKIFVLRKKGSRRKNERRGKERSWAANPKSPFQILSDLNQVVPNHLAQESQTR